VNDSMYNSNTKMYLKQNTDSNKQLSYTSNIDAIKAKYLNNTQPVSPSPSYTSMPITNNNIHKESIQALLNKATNPDIELIKAKYSSKPLNLTHSSSFGQMVSDSGNKTSLIEEKLKKYRLELNNDTNVFNKAKHRTDLSKTDNSFISIENGQSSNTQLPPVQANQHDLANKFILDKLLQLEQNIDKLNNPLAHKYTDQAKLLNDSNDKSINLSHIPKDIDLNIIEDEITLLKPIPKQPEKVKPVIAIADDEVKDIVPIMERVSRLKELKAEKCEKR
jgi:hypothetical protein